VNDYRFVAGVIFLQTEWHELGDADFEMSFPDRAFQLFGIWNDGYVAAEPSAARASGIGGSAFEALCDAWKPTT
jgi:hypothetical protein